MALDATSFAPGPDSPERLGEIEKLSQDLGDAYEQLTLIYRTVQHLGASFDLSTIAARLVDHAVEAAPAVAAALYLHDGASDANALEVVARAGEPIDLTPDAIARLGSLRRPMFWAGDTARQMVRAESSNRQVDAALCAPLDAGGRALGFLVLFRRGERFTTVESKLLGAISAVSAVAVANWQHYRAIQNEREMLDGVIREIGDGIVIAGADWRARHTNPAARTFLGCPATGFDVLAALREFDLTRDEATLREFAPDDSEFRATSRDPRRPLVLACRAFRASFGAGAEPIHVLRLRDATREHHAAEAQRDFMSLASHKLRTPLTKILGLLPLMGDDSPPEVRSEGAAGIEQGATELSRLVDGILDFIDFRRGGHAIEDVDIGAVARDAIAVVAAQRKTAPPLLLECAERLPRVRGARHLLDSLARNLIDNAAKFSARGSAAIEITVHAPTSDGVELLVVDHGPGIAPELVSRLFAPFSQQDLGFTGQDDGAGLGLLLAREAALRHGGSLTVDSALGKGSTFRARLPINGFESVPR